MTVAYEEKRRRRRVFVRSGRRMPHTLWLVNSDDLHVRITVRGFQERMGMPLALRRAALLHYAKERQRWTR